MPSSKPADIAEPIVAQADVVVLGSGCAGLTAALRAAAGGLTVIVLEKSEFFGGTSAMAGGGVWIPANHYALAAGLDDSPEEGFKYLRSTGPEGWHNQEEARWRKFAFAAPEMLKFVEGHSPLRFVISSEPDPLAEYPGGKLAGRTISPLPLSRLLLGPYAAKLRRSTWPHLLTYKEFTDLDPYHRPVRSVLKLSARILKRLATDSAGMGNALMTGLLAGCLKHKVKLELGMRATRLVTDDAGAVTGVMASRTGKTYSFSARRGVVIATGGFEWNPTLLQEHFPGPFDRFGSPRTNEGDGQLMAQAIGAALERMDQANLYPQLPVRYEGKPHGIPIPFNTEPHAILVDRHGRRFVSEYAFNIGEALDRRDPRSGEPLHLPAYLIADSRFMKQSMAFHWYARKDKTWIKQASSLTELATALVLPPGNLTQTVERFNSFCDTGRDLDFNRGESIWERYKAKRVRDDSNPSLGKLEVPPFYGMSFNRAILGTKGGPSTNEEGQVLRPDGSRIGNLFCAGVAMANPIGTRAVGAGTTLGPCMTWGYIAAETILNKSHQGD